MPYHKHDVGLSLSGSHSHTGNTLTVPKTWLKAFGGYSYGASGAFTASEKTDSAWKTGSGSDEVTFTWDSSNKWTGNTSTEGSHTHSVSESFKGSNTPFSIMPPYLGVYVWRRVSSEESSPSVGDTIILDGIECIVIAKDITIQGSTKTNIAIDKKYDLGQYFHYLGDTWGTKTVNQVNRWVWGGYGTEMGNTSQEVGYGLQNTLNYLANTVNATNGTSTYNYTEHPSLYRGLIDFRNAHGNKWFLPSSSELALVYSTGVYKSLDYYASTGATFPEYGFWSSSECSAIAAYCVSLSSGVADTSKRYDYYYVRLCRAF